MLSKKFEEYSKGFEKAYPKPTMGELISNGWMEVKDFEDADFEAIGEADGIKYLRKRNV